MPDGTVLREVGVAGSPLSPVEYSLEMAVPSRFETMHCGSYAVDLLPLLPRRRDDGG
jgi:hypothetical protein